MIYIIGSGPTGIASAMALLSKGQAVTMLDAGIELEPSRQESVDRMATQPHKEWESRSVAQIKENMESSAAGIPLKYSYGSNFPYKGTDELIPRQIENVALLPSLAKGGFSNVWGSAILPYLKEDIQEWPITVEDLAPHYRSVLSFMPVSGQEDDLATKFPLYTEQAQPLPASNQIQSFLRSLDAKRQDLHREGFLYGTSRLAVMPRNDHGYGCAACGLCMYGCPYKLIYNSSQTLETLKKHPLFTYRNGFIVETLSEQGDQVIITAKQLDTSEHQIFRGSRVYVAAGTISTTRLMLNSLQAYNQELVLKDSQYFLLPLLRYKATCGVATESLHTLAQAFLEVFDPAVSDKSIHLQIYTYNDLFREAIKSAMKFAYPVFKSAANAFLTRFLLIQGYLHSDFSSTITVKLAAPEDKTNARLIMKGGSNPKTQQTINKLVRKLQKNRRHLGAVPLQFLLKLGEPGRGFHSGGTLPMRRSPGKFETDIWGRPTGYQQVHLVDSTVFPSIPASTITLTAMANAHRIASADLAA